MKDNEFKPEPITSERISQFDDRTIERCYEAGIRGIDALIETGRATRRNCITILGWIIAAMTSMLGFLIYHIVSGNPDIIICIMAAYGILSSGAVAYRLYTGALSNVPIYHSGAEPSMLIRDEVVRSLKKFSPDEKYRYVLGWQLEVIQDDYEKNLAVNERLVRTYRSSVKLICLLLLSALVLFLLLMALRLVL